MNVEPTHVDYGNIEVLMDVPRHITVSNESLIPATFSARLVRPTRPVFRVDPSSGEISPQGRVTLVIVANLDDCLQYFSPFISIIFQRLGYFFGYST